MASANPETVLDASNDTQKGLRRSESKKRKFRPFSAVRKLFGGGKSKRKNSSDEENHAVSATKDRPSSAPVLHASPGQDRLVLQRKASGEDNRGVSEDGMMSPERKEGAITLTQKSPDPNLPKSAFKAELAGKLNKRRSFCSEEDEEDGLRQGLVPPVLTTDATTTDRSDQEDLFNSRWSSAVSSPAAQSGTTPQSQEPQGSVDLSTMVRTELLRSDAAKDRISVKPRARKSGWQSRKNRQGRYSLSLPSLVETDSGGGGGRPRSEYIDPSVLSDFDLTTIPSAISATELTLPEKQTTKTPSQKPSSTVRTISDVSATGVTEKQDQGVVGTKADSPPPPQHAKTHRVSFAAECTSRSPETQTTSASPVVKLPQEKNGALQLSGSSSDVRTTVLPQVALSTREVKAEVTPTVISVRESSSLSSSSSSSVPAERKREGLRQADSQTEDAFSPKPDYKIRRQQRSKTLPAHQSIVTVQRTASQREDLASPPCIQKPAEKQGHASKNKEEPAWVALARRKSLRHHEEAESSVVSVAAPGKELPKTSSSASTVTESGSVVGLTVTASVLPVQTVSTSVSSALPNKNAEPKTPLSSDQHTRKTQSTHTLPTSKPAPSTTITQPKTVSVLTTTQSSTTKLQSRPIHSSKSHSLPRLQSRVEKLPSTPSFQTELIQRTLEPGDVKIELIENSSSRGGSKSGGNKGSSDSKVGEAVTDTQSDQCRPSSSSTKRHSRVMDLMKNFENLQTVT